VLLQVRFQLLCLFFLFLFKFLRVLPLKHLQKFLVFLDETGSLHYDQISRTIIVEELAVHCYIKDRYFSRMHLSSWETNALYMFQKTRFRLSIPYSHSFTPVLVSMHYNPEWKRIEIIGSLKKSVSTEHIDAEMSPFNPQISHNIAQSVHCLYGERFVEKNAEPKLS
jgi:hypothetical protein